MKTVNYRTSTIIGRLLICAMFILSGVALILASLYLEAPTVRKIYSVAAGILGIGFFGRMAVMLIILLSNKQMFRYDQENIIVKDKTITLDSIKNVEEENGIRTVYLGIKTPAFVLKPKDGGEPIYIPTYYVISKRDYKEPLN